MANEFVARKGLISSGSIDVRGSVTASYFVGDGSKLTNISTTTALSSSLNIDTYTFVGNGTTTNYLLSKSYEDRSVFVSVDGLSLTSTLDYVLSAQTASFLVAPPSQSNILVRAFVNVSQNITGSFSGSFVGDGRGLFNVSTASFATSASYALNAGAGAGFPYSGSAVITGSLLVSQSSVTVTGSLNVLGSISGALVLPTGTVSSSSQIQLASISGTTFASSNFTFPQNVTITGTVTAREFYTQVVSSSIIYQSGSTKFGDTVDDVMSVTGSIGVSGSMFISSSGNVGIGTINPSSKLHVQGNVSASTITTSGDSTIAGVTIGRGTGAISTNTAVGNSALAANTTGNNNIGVGYTSLYNVTTGVHNVGIGVDAIRGVGSGMVGGSNVAVGSSALSSISSGSNNVAIGRSALTTNTTGDNNTAVGTSAHASNTTGYENVAVGVQALSANVTGIRSTAVGYAALLYAVSDNNTAFGFSVGRQITAGTQNTLVGGLGTGGSYTAGQTTSGSYNTIVGVNAFWSNTTGSYNTITGYYAGYYTNTDGNTFYGGYAGYNATGTTNNYIGYTAGYYMTTGAYNTILGTYSGNGDSLDLRTTNNNIVLSDGQGNARLYYDGTSNFWAFRNGGNERVRIDSAGNVGIGTTSPQTTLQVWGNGRFGNTTTRGRVGLIQTNGNENAYIECNTNNALTLYGYGGLNFQSNGTNPTPIDSTYGIQFMTWGGSRLVYFDGYQGFGGEVIMRDTLTNVEVFHAYLATPSTPRVVFPSGSVGIGITSPSALLHISASGTNNDLLVGSTSVPKLFISASNNIGIGTTSPGATLHVQGNVSASSFTGSLLGTATTASFSLVSAVQPITGKVIYVDSTSPNATNTRTNISKYNTLYPFSTVQAAVNAATTGDTIWVYPGTYSESVIIGSGSSINMLLYSGVTIDGGTSSSITSQNYSFVNIDMMPNSIIKNTGNSASPSGSATVRSLSNSGLTITGLSNPRARTYSLDNTYPGYRYSLYTPTISSVNAYCMYSFGTADFGAEKISGVTIVSQNSIPVVNCSLVFENCAIFGPKSYGVYNGGELINCLIVSNKTCYYIESNVYAHLINCEMSSSAEYGVYGTNWPSANFTVNGCRMNTFSQSIAIGSNNTSPVSYEISNNIFGSKNLASSEIISIADGNASSVGIFSNNVVNKSTVTLPTTINQFNTSVSDDVSGSIPYILTS